MLESSNGGTCDVRIGDLVVNDNHNQDGYSKVGENTRRVFAFGKCAKMQNKGTLHKRFIEITIMKHSECYFTDVSMEPLVRGKLMFSLLSLCLQGDGVL